MPPRNPDSDYPGLKLLSLDGGGIRGVSTLIILKHLMKRINPTNPPKPCEYFDLIGGTSTGGIIAIMLGRLRMDVQTCIDKYMHLASAAFKPKRPKVNFLPSLKDKWEARGTYQSDNLVNEIRQAVQEQLDSGDPEARLLDLEPVCKVFVCAYTKAGNTPVLLRSYTTNDSVDALAGSECTIWQAARATSAAVTFFDPIQIGRQTFVDGGTGLNNPVERVLEEAESIWPDAKSRIQCLVSVGTGVPDLKDFGDNLREVVMTLKEIATETENTERRFYKTHNYLGIGGRYFRFNVDKGLAGVGLDEHKKIDKIEASTESYLRDPRVKDSVDTFLAARTPQVSLLDERTKDQSLNWLNVIDPLAQHTEARKYRKTDSTGHDLTGNWFLDGPFEDWKVKENSFLWLTGKPGSGKSVLSSAIIDTLEKAAPEAAVIYYYFSFRDLATQNVTNFKHSLLMQIVRRLVLEDERKRGYYYVPMVFQKFFKKYAHSQFPLEEDVQATFEALLNESRLTYIIIDALDECPDQIDRGKIIEVLAGLCKSSHGGAHILITSRRENDIETAVNEMGVPKSIVLMETEKVNADIKTYLIDSMKKEPYKKWPSRLKKKVVMELMTKADGVFRWAALQLVALKDKDRDKDVENCLKDLPENLEETYEVILTKIANNKRSGVALSILKWLAYSQRSILLSEVSEIAIFEMEKCSPTDPDDYAVSYDPKDRFPSIWAPRKILSGLITVSGIDDRDEVPEDQDGFVSFSHFTVQQYLQGENVKPRIFHLNMSNGHWYIARSCLSYLGQYDVLSQKPQDSEAPVQLSNSTLTTYLIPDLDLSDLDSLDSETPEPEPTSFKPYPLLLYASKYWWEHVVAFYNHRDMTSSNAAVGKVASVLDELQGQTSTLTLKMALYNRNVASGPELSDLVQSLGSRFSKSETQEAFDDILDFEDPLALRQVSGVGDEALAQMLLDAGVDVNAGVSITDRGITGETALHRAVVNGHQGVMEQLVENGADLELKNGNYRTSLSLAAEHGFTDITRFLVDKGAKLNSKDVDFTDIVIMPPEWFQSIETYHPIAALGHYAHGVVRGSWRGWFPLQYAIANGKETTAIVLVEKGASCLDKDFYGGCALSLAIMDGQEAVLRSMISNNREVYTTTTLGESWTALHLAATYRNLAILEILLENVAELDIEDQNGYTPMDLAAMGAQELLKAMMYRTGWIAYSSDTYLRKKAGRASSAIKLLHSRGASLGPRGDLESTPLHLAATFGQLEAAETLVQCGAVVDARNTSGWTPLLGAASQGHAMVVEMLLGKGAKINAVTENGVSALIMASGNGHLEVARVLLKAGADMSMAAKSGETALEAASGAGKEDLVRLLQEYGADAE